MMCMCMCSCKNIELNQTQNFPRTSILKLRTESFCLIPQSVNRFSIYNSLTQRRCMAIYIKKNIEGMSLIDNSEMGQNLFYIINLKSNIRIESLLQLQMELEIIQPQAQQEQTIRDDDKDQNMVIDVLLKPNVPKIIRVIAAPGSGKTTTICRFLKRMYLESQKPLYPNFLVLTFTKRTRRDLLKKISELVGSQSRKDYMFNRVRNFHSLAYSLIFWSKIIQEDEEKEMFNKLSQKLVFPSYESNPNRQKQIKDRIKSIAWKKIHQFFAQAYTEEQQQNQLQRLKASQEHKLAYQLIIYYLDWIKDTFKQQKKVTFDYAIVKAIEYINDPDRKCWNIDLNSIDLIIVDQFQDSNPAQVKIIESLMRRSKKQVKLLMIGDYDQNIYNWRGAKISTIQKLIESQKWHSMFLRRTYRLSEPVMNISQKLINSNPEYKEFRQKIYQGYNLQAMNKKRVHPILVQQFDSEYSEVRWVVDKLYEHIAEGYQPGDITILCREFKNIKFYEKLKFQLNRQKGIRGGKQIPYDYQQSRSAMGKKQGLYLTALLRYFYKVEYLHQKGDKNDIKRILQLKNIGEKDQVWGRIMQNQRIDRIYQKYYDTPRKLQQRQQSWTDFFVDFQKMKKIMLEKLEIQQTLQAIHSILAQCTWLSQEMVQSCVIDFIDVIKEYGETIDKQELAKDPTYSIIRKIAEQSDEGERIHSDDEDGESDKQQDQEKKVEKKQKKVKISNYEKKKLAMRKQLKDAAKRNRVLIQTIHNAKGLQYKIVFLCGLNHGYLQSEYQDNAIDYRSLNDAENERKLNFQRDSIVEKMNQELRLIYTAITRTSGHIYVSASKKDYLKYQRRFALPVHPVFQKLKELCNCQQTIQFNNQKDGPSRKYIQDKLKQIQEENKKKAEKKAQRKQKMRTNET